MRCAPWPKTVADGPPDDQIHRVPTGLAAWRSAIAFYNLLGQNHRLLKSDAHGEEIYRQLWTTIREGRAWRGVLQNRRKDGAPYWVQSRILPLGGDAASHGGYISLRTDITERERLRLALERLARADVLHYPFELFSEALAYGLDATAARE